MDDLIVQLFQKYPVLLTVLAGLLAAHTLAVFVVNLTPTPKDDAFLAKFYGYVEKVAGIVTPHAKDRGAESKDEA